MLVSANKASCAGSRPGAARKILTELSRHRVPAVTTVTVTGEAKKG